MKKYLQACETGGSIYGKERAAEKGRGPDDRCAEKEDLTGTCNRLYKKQIVIMNKVFRRDR